MFGMMFGDVGHGLLLVLLGLALRSCGAAALASLRRLWPLPFAAGSRRRSSACSTARRSARPGSSRAVARAARRSRAAARRRDRRRRGAARPELRDRHAQPLARGGRRSGDRRPVRDRRPRVFLGGGMPPPAGISTFARSRSPARRGRRRARPARRSGSRRGRARRGRRRCRTIVEVFDAVVRIAGNTVSFARLAAFGLVHAALGTIVWRRRRHVGQRRRGRGRHRPVRWSATRSRSRSRLLVAGVQALRLEYYELFSRVFAGEGRPFRHGSIPARPQKEEP